MKKILCLLLAVAMLFSLCGCLGDSGTTTTDEDVRGDITNENIPQDEVIDDTADTEFSLGKTTNNIYNNDFLGLSCTFPEGWEFYSDEKIMELNNLAKDAIDDEDISKQLESANIIYDMYANNPIDGSNVNINLEKLTPAQILKLNIKETLEAQIETIKSTYNNIGYTDIDVNYQKIKVDGKSVDSLALTAKIQDIDYYATIFTFKKGTYLANVSLGSLVTDNTDTILGYFKFK